MIEAAAQISESDIPLEELEEHVKALMAEKETLQREIDEKRAILDGVYEDVESRRKIMEEYAQMKAELRRFGIAPEDPRKIQACFQRLKDANYNATTRHKTKIRRRKLVVVMVFLLSSMYVIR